MPEFISDFFTNDYVLIVLLTLAPFLELRASIPFGIAMAHKPWFVVVAIAVVVNIILGPIVYFLLDKTLNAALRVGLFKRFWDRVIAKTQKKIHPLVEKYGILGLGLFIGVPLPGSGVYSGAFGGYVLGFRKREFYVATVVGVLIAATAVTAVVLSGSKVLSIFIKNV